RARGVRWARALARDDLRCYSFGGALEAIVWSADRHATWHRRTGDWSSGLLDRVGRLVRQRVAARATARIVRARAEEDVRSARKRRRIHLARQRVGLAISVHPHARQISAKS